MQVPSAGLPGWTLSGSIQRNVKGLQLQDEAPKPAPTAPLAAPKGHKLAQASTSSSSSSSPSVPSSAFSSASSRGYSHRLSEQLANLELGIEFKLDLRAEDLELINELGAGNGGTVSMVRHIPTGAIMARKVRLRDLVTALSRRSQVVHIDAKPSVRKQIVRELQIMHDCVRLARLASHWDLIVLAELQIHCFLLWGISVGSTYLQ
jgi:mitogen-activated protein kinase kinase